MKGTVENNSSHSLHSPLTKTPSSNVSSAKGRSPDLPPQSWVTPVTTCPHSHWLRFVDFVGILESLKQKHLTLFCSRLHIGMMISCKITCQHEYLVDSWVYHTLGQFSYLFSCIATDRPRPWSKDVVFKSPDHPCMVYLPTFGKFLV